MRAYRIANTPAYYYYDDNVPDSPERDQQIEWSVRHCRIFAMAYTMGWLNGRKNAQRRAR